MPPSPRPLLHLLPLLLLHLLHLLAAHSTGVGALPVFDVRAYGAVGDGQTLNTAAIGRAIAAAAAAAPAQVLVTDGVYRSGQIVMASGVWLNISASGTLLCSSDRADWAHLQPGDWMFVFGVDIANTGVVGEGTIDGDQPAYIGGWSDLNNEFIPATWAGLNNCSGECRPRNVQFRNCTNVLLDGVLVTQSPDWTIHLLGCDGVVVRNVRQYGDYHWPNNDGIDIDSSRNVWVTNITINTGDDGVCLKSTIGYGELANVTVDGAVIRSRSSAIKFGSATPEDMHDLVFQNVIIWDSNGGLSIQARDGGHIYNVLFRNASVVTRNSPLNWWGLGEAIWISSMPRDPTTTPGRVTNITYQDIVAVSQNTPFLSGRAPGNVVDGVTLSNVNITIDRWPAWNYSTPGLDYRPTTAIPLQIVPHATQGLYVESVSNLVLTDVSVTFNMANVQPYWGHGCFNFSNAGFPVTQTRVSCSPFGP